MLPHLRPFLIYLMEYHLTIPQINLKLFKIIKKQKLLVFKYVLSQLHFSTVPLVLSVMLLLSISIWI